MRLTYKGITTSAALAALVFLAPPAASSASDAVDLPETVVTATPIDDDARYASPGAVTIVRPAERAGEARTLPELIEDVPGLAVIRARGRHGYTVASVRGSTSSQVAVYVDGVLMNLQSEAAVDLSAIPTEQIERIEVYRGYVPARFGAQAMGGVINIVTQSPRETRTRLVLGAGSFGRYRAALSSTMQLGSGRLLGALGWETYDGDFKYWNDGATPYNTDDDYTGKRRDNGFKRGDVMLKWQDEHWRAKFSFVRNDRDLALPAPGIDREGTEQRPGALLDTKRYDLLVGRSQTSGSVNWDWEVKYTAQTSDYDSRRGESLSAIGGSSVTRSSYDAKRWQATLSANWAAGERHFVEALLDYANETLDAGGDTVSQYLGGIPHYTRDMWSATLQDTIALDRAARLTLTPSLRWYSQDGDGKLTWQIAAAYEMTGDLMLKGTYGTYSRAPNMYEQYGDGAFILPAASSLKWEEGTQFDIGLYWNRTTDRSRASASLSYFSRRSDNLIEFVMENPRYGRYTSIAEARVQGVELEALYGRGKWDLSLSGAWLDGENLTPDAEGSVRQYGKTLPNRPEWTAAVRATRRFGDVSAFAEYRYIGSNFADTSENVQFGSRNVWNIGAKIPISKRAELSLGVFDLTDSADDLRMRPNGMAGPVRMLWHPLEGRSYWLTLTMDI